MKFAHFADTHLGFQKDRSLQKLEEGVFGRAVDACISEGVDFVLLCGDFFHVNIPEMRVQKLAMKKMRELYLAGIPVYTVYGSHDFSPISNSAIDLLEAAGYLIKVTRASHDSDGKIRLDFVQDDKTGVKLAGLSGLKAGRDLEHYESLDRGPLEDESGFRIFLFHGAIGEMSQGEGDSMPLSLLPRNFDYYAGGHLHEYRSREFPGYPRVVYPGTLFAGYHSDMEESASGTGRGFVMVDFDHSGIKSVEQVPVPACEYCLVRVDADARSAASVSSEIAYRLGSEDVRDRVVILRVHGELGSGRVTDIDLGAIRRGLEERGALHTLIHRRDLRSREYKIREAYAGTKSQIEHGTFQENAGQLRMKRDSLTGENGVRLAKDLLAAFASPRPENEKQTDYKNRMQRDALAKMGLDRQ